MVAGSRPANGRPGPYVPARDVTATPPRGIADPRKLTGGEALQLILDRRAKGPARKKTKRAAKKTPRKKKTR